MIARALTSQEPLFILKPHDFDFCEMEGSRAMLIEEGLIPNDTVWPQDKNATSWQSGQFTFWLWRWRPAGTKGAVKSMDWFRLRWQLTDESARTALTIRHKTKELAVTIRDHTPEGKAECFKLARKVSAALSDPAFQQFKTMLGIPSRQRRRKATH